MSVYTTVKKPELSAFLNRYDIGQLTDFSAITAGITNTNYYLNTDSGQYVLTLYEHHSNTDLDYILGLQQHLHNAQVACSFPIADRQGNLYSTLNGRPAAINHRVSGTVVANPDLVQCLHVGRELAKFHLAGIDYLGQRTNPRGADWWVLMSETLDKSMSAKDQQLLQQTLDEYHNAQLEGLPAGAIHADLFRDNALFLPFALGGIIDFDYACHDYFIFDLAVTVNDWCSTLDGYLGNNRVKALMNGYQQVRMLKEQEKSHLPLMLRVAALRFWLSRLYDKTFPLSGEHTYIKCPDSYRDLLIIRSQRLAVSGQLDSLIATG